MQYLISFESNEYQRVFNGFIFMQNAQLLKFKLKINFKGQFLN